MKTREKKGVEMLIIFAKKTPNTSKTGFSEFDSISSY